MYIKALNIVDSCRRNRSFFLKWYRRSCFRGERMGDHELLDIEEWGLVLNKVFYFQRFDQRGSKSL
jgi:hypothetical protein